MSISEQVKSSGKKQVHKERVLSAEIIVTGAADNPYYEIKYFDLSDMRYHIGYSSYDLNIVFGYLEKYFEIVKENKCDTIAEQTTSLRDLAEMQDAEYKKRIINKAADTIEDLSAKLQAANKEQAVSDCDDGWIPCSEKYPENEKEVEITFIRKHWKTREPLYCTARAFYEDGKLNTEDSSFHWEDTDNFEYDEEKDGYLIPEGWWESVSFSEEFGAVDMPVIAWKEITEPYYSKERKD